MSEPLEQTSTGARKPGGEMSFSSLVTRLAEQAAQGIYYSTSTSSKLNDEETTTANTTVGGAKARKVQNSRSL